jgi:hypothetical protein
MSGLRQGLMEVLAQEPSDTQTVGRYLHELTLASDVLKEHDCSCRPKKTTGSQRSDGPNGSVAIAHQLPDERKVYGRLQAAVEVVLWDELFEGDAFERREGADLGTHQ